MKKPLILLLTILLLSTFVSALPSNFYEPQLLVNVSSSVCNDVLFGYHNNLYYCTYDAGSTTYLRSVTSDDTVVQSINLGGVNVQDGFVNDNGILSFGTTSSNTVIRFYDVTNNLNMDFINSTSISGAYTTKLMFYYDNVWYYNYNSVLRALTLSDGVVNVETVSSISVLNNFIDVKEFGGSKYFAIEDYILDEDYNIIASGTSGSDWYFVNNDLGIRKDGTLININDLSSVIILSLNCDNFSVVYPFSSNYILGVNTNTNNYAVCDVSNLGSISVEDTNVSVVNVPSADSYFYANENQDYFWQISNLDVDGGEVIGNNAPLGVASFVGLDNNNKFLFKVSVSDEEGGPSYYAISYDEIVSSSTLYDINNFDSLSSLIGVSSDFCNSSYSITTDVPYYPFGTDGSLLFNGSSCVGDFVINNDLTGFLGGDINVLSSWFYDYPITSGNYTSSFSLYDDNLLIKQFIILINYDSNNMSFYYNNGTYLGSFSSDSVVVFDGDFNTFDDVLTFEFRNQFDVSFGDTLSLGVNIADVNNFVFNQYSTADLYTYVDYVSSSSDVSPTTYLPIYLSFGVLTAGITKTKVVRKDNTGFGDYEAYLYVTDSDLGTTYYSDEPYYFTFTVDENTPVLSEEEISNLESSGGFVEGDLVTDKLEYYLDALGFKTVGSRMIVGLVIMLLTMMLLYGFGSEVIIVALIAEFVVLSYIGLFPVWFVALVSIIAGGMVAIAFRRTVSGGN